MRVIGKKGEEFEDDDDLVEMLKYGIYEEGKVVFGHISFNRQVYEKQVVNELKKAIDVYISKRAENKIKTNPLGGGGDSMLKIQALPLDEQLDYLSTEITKLVDSLQFDQPNTNTKLMSILSTIVVDDGGEIANETQKDSGTKRVMSIISQLLNKSPQRKKDLNSDDPEYYDSLSEDQPNSPIKSLPRSKDFYNSGPVWNGKWRVWTSGDERHHTRVNQRYAITDVSGDHKDDMIESYCNDEKQAQHGYIKSSYAADILAITCALVSSAALAYCIIERLGMCDADSVNFFYSVSLMIILHVFVFSVFDGLLYSFCSVWIRRNRMISHRSLTSI